MKIINKNYDALFIHEDGHQSHKEVDYISEALSLFKNSKTAKVLKIYKATHNKTRLKLISTYDIVFK